MQILIKPQDSLRNQRIFFKKEKNKLDVALYIQSSGGRSHTGSTRECFHIHARTGHNIRTWPRIWNSRRGETDLSPRLVAGKYEL